MSEDLRLKLRIAGWTLFTVLAVLAAGVLAAAYASWFDGQVG